MADSNQEPPVLIIEDDQDTAELLAVMLQARDCACAHVSNREEAVKLLKVYTPRVLVMDYRVPGMAPERFVPHVRRICPECKIVLLTGDNDMQEIARRLAVDACFLKPADMAALAELVNKFVAKAPVGCRGLPEP